MYTEKKVMGIYWEKLWEYIEKNIIIQTLKVKILV